MLLQLLYEHAEVDPARTAVVYRDERLSRAELVERIERLASGLAGRGIGPGDAVGLVLRDDPWFIAAFQAVAALGAKVVPANPAFKQAELEFWFRSTGVRAVISDERTAGVCERIAAGFDHRVEVIGSGAGHGQSVTLADLVEAGSAERLPARDPDEPLVGQFSSGSTGRPKRLDRNHRPVRGRGRGVPWVGADAGGQDPRCCAALPHLGDGRVHLRLGDLRCDAGDPRGPPPVPAQAPPGAGADRGGADYRLPRRPLQLPSDGRLALRRRPLFAAPLLHRRDGDAAGDIRSLRRALRRTRPAALRQHRDRDDQRQHGRRPGRDLRVGRHPGEGGRDRDRRRRRRPAAARGCRRGDRRQPRRDARLRRPAGAEQGRLPRRPLLHRRPRPHRRERECSTSLAARSC